MMMKMNKKLMKKVVEKIVFDCLLWREILKRMDLNLLVFGWYLMMIKMWKE